MSLCTVVVNIHAYNEKIMSLLEDRAAYRKLNKDPANTAENKIKCDNVLYEMKGHLCEEEYRHLHAFVHHEDVYQFFSSFQNPQEWNPGETMQTFSFISSSTYAC